MIYLVRGTDQSNFAGLKQLAFSTFRRIVAVKGGQTNTVQLPPKIHALSSNVDEVLVERKMMIQMVSQLGFIDDERCTRHRHARAHARTHARATHFLIAKRFPLFMCSAITCHRLLSIPDDYPRDDIAQMEPRQMEMIRP